MARGRFTFTQSGLLHSTTTRTHDRCARRVPRHRFSPGVTVQEHRWKTLATISFSAVRTYWRTHACFYSPTIRPSKSAAPQSHRIDGGVTDVTTVRLPVPATTARNLLLFCYWCAIAVALPRWTLDSCRGASCTCRRRL